MNIHREEIQSRSEIDVFNKIGNYSKDKGFGVIYFKSLMPTLIKKDTGNRSDSNINIHDRYLYDTKFEYMHYIHLYKDSNLKLSIFFDQYNLSNPLGQKAYYEIYDLLNTERFFKGNENDLFNRVEQLLE